MSTDDIAPTEEELDVTETIVIEGATVVQLVGGDALAADAMLVPLHDATVTISDSRITAADGRFDWQWDVDDLERVVHAADSTWTLFDVPEVEGFGVAVPADRLETFRAVFDQLPDGIVAYQEATVTGDEDDDPDAASRAPVGDITSPYPVPPPASAAAAPMSRRRRRWGRQVVDRVDDLAGPATLAGLDARDISAWFGSHQVLDRVSLEMPAGEVTALIGPSGCGKSTFLRILNRMHEMIPGAGMAGEVLLDGHDVYDANRKITDARREIGMVFQKPNPFPAMSIYDNVLASLRVTGVKATTEVKDALVESCLSKAGLWNEVKDRLRQPGGGLSGGQQQRLCIARALALRPRVLLMDEPCSALDPTSTRRIEQTIKELVSEVTIVIVTHNMQQAARVSDQCAFFLAEQGTPGLIVEHGPTRVMFTSPRDERTNDYVNGRFG